MGASDLRVTVDSVKLRCVLDPALAVGHPWGPRLAQGLTRVFETWLTRHFWQVLDSSELLPYTGTRPGIETPDTTALCEWSALRESTDAGAWLLRWVGDCLGESQLPQWRTAGAQGLVDRYESLAAALQDLDDAAGPRPGWCRGLDPLAGALDALALSAALDGALILCALPPEPAVPGPVQAMRRLGLDDEDVRAPQPGSLFAAEREVVRQALAGAGLAAMLQPLGPLAVVHALTLPAAAGCPDAAGPWHRARCWWYPV
ncbi:MAG: putative rane associated protein [Pseudomonadota bacterium]|jgi:hypothetical protein